MAPTFKICPFPYKGIAPYMEIIAKSDSHYVTGSYKPFCGQIKIFLALGPVLWVIEA